MSTMEQLALSMLATADPETARTIAAAIASAAEGNLTPLRAALAEHRGALVAQMSALAELEL